MGGHLVISRIEIGLIPVGRGHPAFQIIGYYDRWDGLAIVKGPHMGADPIRQSLGPGGLGVGIVGGAQDGDKDLRLSDLSGGAIHDRYRLSRIIDKQLLPGPVVLAHDEIERPCPGSILLTKLAVL